MLQYVLRAQGGAVILQPLHRVSAIRQPQQIGEKRIRRRIDLTGLGRPLSAGRSATQLPERLLKTPR